VSYLAKYVAWRPALGRPPRGVRVDERTRLNRPGLYGDASVRVFVEDTSVCKWRRQPPVPHLRLRVSDCVNEITLEFSVESAELRENSLFKIDTLLAALHRFRDGLAAEAELFAHRDQHRRTRKEDRCRT
jgi:hypothetical protein